MENVLFQEIHYMEQKKLIMDYLFLIPEGILNIFKNLQKKSLLNKKDILVDPLGKQCIKMLVRDMQTQNWNFIEISLS